MNRIRRLAIRLSIATLTVFVGLYIVPNMLLWGRPFPISHVDQLQSPAKVESWNPRGLQLADGRQVMPFGMVELPNQSKTIEIATKEGVEVAADGRVYGLVKIWHWCGNDAVRYDMSRIDIAQLLAFHREGKSSLKPYKYADASFVRTGGGSNRGWSISSRVSMRMAFDPKLKEIFASSN